MDSVTSINTVRDSLRDNLTDPHTLTIPANVSRTGSQWIFSNEPQAATAKYPKVELLKIDNPSNPQSIGSNYWENEEVYINVWLYSKNGFQIRVSGTEYKNAQFIEYFMGQIKTTLKSKFSTLFTAGVKNYKHLNTSQVEYDSETQLYFAAVTIRVQFFTAPT